MRWPLIVVGPLSLILTFAFLMLTSGWFQSTDNAYVQVAKTPVAPSIGGRVVDIYVRENQFVRRGQVLFRLDTRNLMANAQAAEAQLANAELQVRGQRAAYQQQVETLAAAEETAAFALHEEERQRQLLAASVISRQQYEQAAHVHEQARAQAAVAQQAAAQALAQLGGDPGASLSAHPIVLQARAQLELARLSVGYATVYAASDGVVARVDRMPLGTYLNPSQTAFWLLSGQPWIEANFKEDQLAHMKIGQPVEIEVDAFPDADLRGRIASFAPGTGAAFSALPAQNATGNWVKVPQRLPIRIEFDRPPPGMAARAGLSAKVKVDVRPTGRVG